MAVTYKGLTIKFGGDTTGLSNALRTIQKEAKTTQSELRAINNSLKFNPGNTELLRQKQQALNETYTQTKQKLDGYKQALSQLEAKKASGEKLTEQEERQYNQLQRSILTCENQLDRYGKELQEVTKEYEASQTGMYKFGQKLDDNKDKLQKVGKGLTTAGKAIGGASIAVGTAAVSALKEVSAGYDQVITKTGASGDKLEKMKEQVKNLASEIPTDFETAGEAIGEVNTRFGLTGSALEKLSGKYIKFAKLNGTDVTGSVDKTQKALTAFGLEAKDADKLLDTLTKTSQDTGASVDTLAEGLVKNAKPFQDLGLDIHQATNFMGQMEISGADSSKVMQGLGKALKNATKDGTPLPQALQDIQKEISGGKKGVDGLQKSYELFGKSGDQIYNAVKNGSLNFNDLAKSMDGAANGAGSVDKTFAQTVKSGDKMTMAMNTLKAAGADIGEELAPVISEFAKGLKTIAERIRSLSPEQKAMIGDIVKVGAVLGGTLLVVGKGVTALAGMGQAFKTASTAITAMKNSQLLANIATKAGAVAQGALNLVMSANPIMLVVAALAALAAGLVFFFTQTEDGRKLWAQFTGALKEKFDAFVKWIQPKIEAVKNFFGGLFDKAKEIGKGIGGAWDTLKKNTGAAFEGIKKGIDNKMTEMKKNASIASGAIKDVLSGNWQAAATKAGVLFGNMKKGMVDKLTSARDAVSGIADKIGNLLGFKGLGDKVRNVFNNIIDFVKNPLQKAKEIVKSAVEKIKSIFKFKWSLPNLKLPHIKVGRYIEVPVLGTIPDPSTLKVEWYANGGAIEPNKRRLIGVGDSPEREWIEPESKLLSLIKTAVAQTATASNVSVAVNVTANVTGSTNAYQLGQNIGKGIESVMKQRGL